MQRFATRESVHTYIHGAGTGSSMQGVKEGYLSGERMSKKVKLQLSNDAHELELTGVFKASLCGHPLTEIRRRVPNRQGAAPAASASPAVAPRLRALNATSLVPEVCPSGLNEGAGVRPYSPFLSFPPHSQKTGATLACDSVLISSWHLSVKFRLRKNRGLTHQLLSCSEFLFQFLHFPFHILGKTIRSRRPDLCMASYTHLTGSLLFLKCEKKRLFFRPCCL